MELSLSHPISILREVLKSLSDIYYVPVNSIQNRSIGQPYSIRVIYVVPVDAEPWPEARRRATEVLEDLQHFFADEMSRHGYGPKTFAIDYSDDGEVCFLERAGQKTKEHFEHHPRNNCNRAAGQITVEDTFRELCFFEACSIRDGQVLNPVAKYSNGRAYLGSLHLKLALREWLRVRRL